jgi:hypothetical protein
MGIPGVQNLIVEVHHLHADELEAFALKTGDNLTDEASLETIWLY